VRPVVWPLTRNDDNIQHASSTSKRPIVMQSTVNAYMVRIVPPRVGNYDRWSLSSDVIGKELCAERLSKSSCFGFGFEGLDFITSITGHVPNFRVITSLPIRF
jgi:hypothetical protein